MSKLNSVKIEGYRSIRRAELEIHALNVLIGANGAGKSNLISFFKMMNEMMAGRLQTHVGLTGHATANLYFGPKVTKQILAELVFEADKGAVDTYRMRLSHAAGDSLVFVEERLSFPNSDHRTPGEKNLGAGHTETLIKEEADKEESGGLHPVAGAFRHLLGECRVFHFHDTGPTARIQGYCYVGDNQRIEPDAGNLAAVLHRLKSESTVAYGRIVANIRQVAPFFDDFELAPSGPGGTDIVLNWRHRGEDRIFGPHQLSDGTLRAICLFSLLGQPKEDLPALIVIDEPELGLHPYALEVLATLCRSVSDDVQLLIGTQSSSFVNHFDPEDIVVVERDGDSSSFVRPDVNALNAWLEEYSLGDVWEKNVIGGGPH